MIRIISLAVLVFVVNSCSSEMTIEDIHVSEKPLTEKQESISSPKQNETTMSTTKIPSKYRNVLLFEPETGWGYDIFEGDKLLIHQPHIPVVQGLRGFKTEDDAQKVADAVVEKLSQGIMPPSLTEEEMIKLGVL